MNSERVMGSQCFTKYKWRSQQDAEAAGGPSIIATQVVSEFAVPRTADFPSFNPVLIYTYKMGFSRS